MSQVVEVAGKSEVQTSRRSSRNKNHTTKGKDKMVSVNCLKRNVKK